jgi:hypothetical protein
MKRIMAYFVIFLVVGGLSFVGINSITQGFPTAEMKVITTPTTSVVNGPVILDAIHNQARVETVSMVLANDQDISKVWGLEGACRESLTYLGYFAISAGVDLQNLTQSDVSVNGAGTPAQTSITLTLPPASILHVELDTQRSRVVHSEASVISQLCGTHLPEMVSEAPVNLQKSAVASARQQGIIKMAQDRASFELKKVLLAMGYTNVTIQFNEAYDDQSN